MRTKFQAVEALVHSEGALEEYKKRFNPNSAPAEEDKNAIMSTLSSGEGGERRRRHTLGSAPPIPNWRDLIF